MEDLATGTLAHCLIDVATMVEIRELIKEIDILEKNKLILLEEEEKTNNINKNSINDLIKIQKIIDYCKNRLTIGSFKSNSSIDELHNIIKMSEKLKSEYKEAIEELIFKRKKILEEEFKELEEELNLKIKKLEELNSKEKNISKCIKLPSQFC